MSKHWIQERRVKCLFALFYLLLSSDFPSLRCQRASSSLPQSLQASEIRTDKQAVTFARRDPGWPLIKNLCVENLQFPSQPATFRTFHNMSKLRSWCGAGRTRVGFWEWTHTDHLGPGYWPIYQINNNEINETSTLVWIRPVLWCSSVGQHCCRKTKLRVIWTAEQHRLANRCGELSKTCQCTFLVD